MSRPPRKPKKKKVAPGQGKATSKNTQNKVIKCGNNHITKLRREVHGAGLSLSDTTGQTQRDTLLRVLRYLGARGLNTPEAVGLGFYRVATRVQELEATGWLIASRRERIVGADGLVHQGMARYVLLGPADTSGPQGKLDLVVPA